MLSQELPLKGFFFIHFSCFFFHVPEHNSKHLHLPSFAFNHSFHEHCVSTLSQTPHEGSQDMGATNPKEGAGTQADDAACVSSACLKLGSPGRLWDRELHAEGLGKCSWRHTCEEIRMVRLGQGRSSSASSGSWGSTTLGMLLASCWILAAAVPLCTYGHQWSVAGNYPNRTSNLGLKLFLLLGSISKSTNWVDEQDVVYICVYIYGEGNGNPLQYSCLENPMDREAW